MNWFALAMIPILVVIALLWGRTFLSVRRKVRSGRADLDDDWDPFR